MIDEAFDLGFQVAGEEVVFQQDAVFQRLMPTFDFSLGLGMIWRTPNMGHAIVFRPIRQVTRDVAGAIIG